MAKDRREEERAQRKKEKKEKKLADTNGVTKSGKKEKKDKKKRESLATEGETEAETTVLDGMDVDGDDDGQVSSKALLGQLVPIAHPLADEKLEKKVLKGVKRATKHKALRRGVKEVVKALRKAPVAGQGVSGKDTGVVVLAADISPLDVIAHLPVLCEDHDVQYVWVPSRAALGEAGNTKRPTSVVLVSAQRGKALKRDASGKVVGEDKGEEGAEGEWKEQYDDLWKGVSKAGKGVKK